MNTISDALKNKKNGLFYGNRVLLPFNAYILKVIINDDIIMDFAPASKYIYISETDAYTEIYFKQYKNIKEAVSKYETIKMIAVEKNENVFDTNNHFKLDVRVGDNHNLTIEKTDDDILFIE